MAQPQQPQQTFSRPPPRPYSPPPGSPSSNTPQQFQLPPNKRQRLSPHPPSSLPGSPYVQSPYSISPGATGPQSSETPHFTHIQLPPNAYTTPYSNGNTTPTLNLPPALPTQTMGNQSPLNMPNQSPAGYSHYPMPQGQPMVGPMAPPSRPADKNKEDGIDPMDVLGGTGIDLREEEQYTFPVYNNSSSNSQQSASQPGTVSASHSFTQFPPGDEASFYGAGPANAAAEIVQGISQEEYEAKAAKQTHDEAAHNLAVERQQELNDPFLLIATVHKKMEKIAREIGVGLNTDSNGKMGTMKLPEDFASPTVRTQTVVGPNAVYMTTSGGFLPRDSLLVDQLALISIALKHRLRGLISGAARLSKERQRSSHGNIPEGWREVAAPTAAARASLILQEGGPGVPRLQLTRMSNPVGFISFDNDTIADLCAIARADWEQEQVRQRKKARREAAKEEAARQGSIAPGTPGSVAPESSEKAPTKKEQKKKADAKVNEAASHAAANVTTAQFLGGGSGLFGKKKYDWMKPAGGGSGSASGTSTPAKLLTRGLPGTSSGGATSASSEKSTTEGQTRLGKWREDGAGGKGIQVRDWISTLELDGKEPRALHRLYSSLH